MDRDGNQQLLGTSLINVVFGEQRAFLASFFEGSCYWVQHLYEQKGEALQEQLASEDEWADYLW